MAIEESMKALTEALNKHTAALEAFVKAAGKGGAAAAGGASSGGSTGTKNTKNTNPTLETIQEKFGAFMSVTDKQERSQRKDIVLAIAGKFGADRATNIPEANRAEALEILAGYEKGEDPLGLKGDDEGEGSPI